MERRILRAVVGIACFVLIALTRADPDLWGHVRFGGDIVQHGLPTSDPYSFTSDIAWVNHEWLAEVLFWMAWAAAGSAGLVLLKVGIVGSMLAFAWSVLRTHSFPPFVVEALFAVLVFGTWPRTAIIRPQLYSLALFAALLWLLQSVEHGRRHRIWLVPMLFIAWINVHGGWIVGFGMFGLYCATSLVSREWRSRFPWLLGASLLSTAALLVNPYGWHMLEFIAATVRVDRSDIVDWLPLWKSGFLILLWLLSAVVAAAALRRRGREMPLWVIAIPIVLGVASLRVSRLDAFFALAVAMLLGPYLGTPRTQTHSQRFHRGLIAAVIVAAVGIVVGTRFTQQPVTCIGLDVDWAAEREAGLFIKVNNLKGRMITHYDWGQYVLWHFGPALSVSLDGRRETVYSEAFIREHYELNDRPYEHLALLERLNADYAWLPGATALIKVLEEQGWVKIFSGPKSTVLARRAGTFAEAPLPETPACFPGP